MILRKKYDKLKYDFRNKECLGAECFAPGEFQHRVATASGSRSLGRSSPCCMRRAYHGCPDSVVYKEELVQLRKKDGWRAS